MKVSDTAWPLPPYEALSETEFVDVMALHFEDVGGWSRACSRRYAADLLRRWLDIMMVSYGERPDTWRWNRDGALSMANDDIRFWPSSWILPKDDK